MNYYETMYIVHPALESGRLKDLILSIESNLVDLGGKTCTIEVWGKKKLAYPINKEKYGMYVLLQFEADGSTKIYKGIEGDIHSKRVVSGASGASPLISHEHVISLNVAVS